MDKVKVSREVAEAIDFVKNKSRWSINDILNHHAQTEWQNPNFAKLNSLTIEDLAKVLLFGYEVEQTPAEQLKNLFDSTRYIQEKDVILKTLEILNIKVSGVNCSQDTPTKTQSAPSF